MPGRISVGAGLAIVVMVLAASERVQATYSIVACDAKTRECGVAVQTNNLAVGASVPYAQAGVGAVAAQFETNPHYGPRGLELLAQGFAPADAMKKILAEDGNFDGEGIESRQVGLVSVDGRVANHTGEEAARADWAGARSGLGYSIQGNGLVGPNVVEAMERAFLKTEGALAERLMAALTAGDLAGGQKTGRESAALLVKTMDGFPMDIDLRVDDSNDPVGGLRKLFDMQSARQQVNQAGLAARAGRLDQARALLIGAVARGHDWTRVWIRGARVAENIEEPRLALKYINTAFTQNPAWADAEIGEGNYSEIGASPEFHRWVSAEKERNAVAAYEQLRESKDTTLERRVSVSRILLEAGHANEAILILNERTQRVEESIELRLLRSTAYAAVKDYVNAMAQCDAALKSDPKNLRVRMRMAELQREATR
jgi:uncharacterized Ntn-hydrolase superfamily protein